MLELFLALFGISEIDYNELEPKIIEILELAEKTDLIINE